MAANIPQMALGGFFVCLFVFQIFLYWKGNLQREGEAERMIKIFYLLNHFTPQEAEAELI